MAIALTELQALLVQTSEVVAKDPAHAPQILSLLLAGGPFRAILQRDDLLDRVVRMAREHVRDWQPQEQHAAAKPTRAPAVPPSAHFRKA